METKTCENCETVIASQETKCPSCGVVFEELEDAVATVQRANSILEKRRAKTAPPTPEPAPAPTPAPTPAPEKKNIFTSMGKVIRSK